jgi:NADPH2:quinone reductase
VRAVVLESVGGPEALVLRDVPPPAAGDGEIAIDVRACALNYSDVLVRRGLYPQPPPLPWVPGMEVAGDAGGRRVLALLDAGGGGYAEQAAASERWVFDLHAGASYEEGASFLTAFLTAWLPLTRQADVRAGTRVLVTAAAGGVGTAAVQSARLLGAEVVAVAGSEAKLELARSLGAAQAVTYERLGKVEPVDVALDPVGGALLHDTVRLLRPLGTLLAVGYAGGPWPHLDPAVLVGRNVGVQGFYLGRLMQLRPEVVRSTAEDLLRFWAEGMLRPVVGGTFPLAGAAEAHRLVEERRSTGKVVLVP